MKKILHIKFAFLFLSVVVLIGCGSGQNDRTSLIESQSNTKEIPPEVGIVLKLFASQHGQSDENKQEKITLLKGMRSQTVSPLILLKYGTGQPKDGPCLYEGWEKYIPENLNTNTIRETFLYDKCKKNHPIASDRISWLNGLQVIDSTDPDYTGTNPLGYPYFSDRKVTKYFEDFTEEEYDKKGTFLFRSFSPKLTLGSYVEFGTGLHLYDKVRHSIWADGSGWTYHTRGTSDLSDDYTVEGVYEDYVSDGFMSDFNKDGNAMTQNSITNGYIKETWLQPFGIRYEDYATTIMRTEDGASYTTIDGAMTPDNCSGEKFAIKTLLSLYKPAMATCPTEGELVVTRKDRNVTLRFLDNQTVEVDIDSDGTVDDTVSCQAEADSDFCMQ